MRGHLSAPPAHHSSSDQRERAIPASCGSTSRVKGGSLVWQRLVLAAIGCLLSLSGAQAQSTPSPFPYRLAPIDYFGDTSEPVARLMAQLTAGQRELKYSADSGYLASLLDALDVPACSQMLIFAKNAANARRISPENPRALYFNDVVSIGWTPGAAALEIAAVDAHKGAVFYTLQQRADEPPRFHREDSCLTCHVTEGTLQVPGFILRSFVTDAQGRPRQGFSPVDHATPYEKRWGGWYVTGAPREFQHLGNLSTAETLLTFDRLGTRVPTIDLAARLPDLKHLRGSSDILPLLVHDHQTRVQTLLTRLRYEAEFDRPLDTLEPLTRALLFANEPPLPAPVEGDSDYRNWFEQQGDHATASRRLREFDLKSRLFRHGCSWLIDSPGCRTLPQSVRQRLFRRIGEIIGSPSPPAGFRALGEAEREELLQLLRETVAGFQEALPD
ncbi:MAG: hypothetical protein EHM42_14410 [Planctomycetaceae bacterium]|nr:MAG: hypothetical protein EHM42_14410 [Planctomycetaceae bacterium]